MAAKKSGKKKNVTWECNNPTGKPYKLWELVDMLETKQDFADFFFAKLKEALDNDSRAIECIESYLEPTDQELIDLGIPLSQVGAEKRCTDAGLLVAVVAKQNARRLR
jgi:hypothetical protein